MENFHFFIMKTKFLTILSVSCISIFAKSTEAKSYANEVLSGQEYHDAALRGELVDKSDPNNFLNFSELKFIGDFPVWNSDYAEEHYYENILNGKISSNASDSELSAFFKKKEKPILGDKEGLYRDLEGNLWFVYNEEKKEEFWVWGTLFNNLTKKEKAEKLALKYIVFKIMDLLVGSWVSEVKLLKDMPGYIAVQPLSGFSKRFWERDRFSSKRLKLEIALDFVGLKKPHKFDHQGTEPHFVFDNSLINPARSGFNYALFHFGDFLKERINFYEGLDLDAYPHIWKDIKGAKMAVESLINIQDDTFLYLLGDCYNDLLKINVNLGNKLFKELGRCLIRRKHLLEEKTYKIFTILERIDSDPESYTSEDEIILHKNINSSLPLYAAKYGLLNLTGFLYDDEKQKNKESFLAAVANGDLENVALLLNEKKTSLNIRDDKGRSPLAIAFIHNRFDVAKFLLENGADLVDPCDRSGESYISIAIERGPLDLLKLLLEKCVDPDFPLEEPVKLLLDQGLAWYGEKQSPLLMAIAEGNVEIVKFLLEKGADPNSHSGCKTRHIGGTVWYPSCTPLTLAVSGDYLDIVKLLLEKGADPNVANNLDQTPLDIAIKRHFSAIEQLLKQYLKSEL